MVHYSAVVKGAERYVENEIIGKMNGSVKAWLLGAAFELYAARVPQLLMQLAEVPAVKMLGLIDGEMVDVDRLYGVLLKRAQAGSATVDVPMVGAITFGPGDVESLYRHIREAAR